jgi:transcriptional regulator with XRE-family HTH domain
LSALGEMIKAIRINKGIDQESLGAALDCSREAISQYESGKRDVPTTKVKAIAKHLEIDPLDLLEIKIKDQIETVIKEFRSAI